MRWIQLVLVLGLMLVTAPGCREDNSAAAMMRERLELSSQSEHGRVWDMLHPAHQALVTREQFVECGQVADEQGSPAIGDVDVLSEEAQTKTIPAIGDVEVTVVTLEWQQGGDTRIAEFDAIEVDGDWRWVLPESALGFFQRGECPVVPRDQ
jgi:hypothetical protein